MLTREEANKLKDMIHELHNCGVVLKTSLLENLIYFFTEKENPDEALNKIQKNINRYHKLKDEPLNKIEDNVRRFFEIDESIRITKIDLLDGWQWANRADLGTKVNEIAVSFNALIKRLQKMGCIGIHGE